MENDDFLLLVKKMSDEELMLVYPKRNEYAEDNVAVIEEELVIRGYDPNEFSSLESAQQQLLKQKKDSDLFELLNNKESVYSTDFVKQEIERRELTVSKLEEDYYSQGKRGNIALLIGLPLVGSVIIPIIGLGAGKQMSGSVLTLIALVMAINHLVSSKRLSTGEKVKKYDEKTRKIALVLLIIMLLNFAVNFSIIFSGNW